MLKFCASVAWRSLLYIKQRQLVTQLSEHQVALIDDALLTWSRFLRGEYKHTGAFELHLLPFAEIAETGMKGLPPNINRYLTRAIDIDYGANDSVCFTYSKLGPFAVFGFVQPGYSVREWKGTKVHHRGGWFGPGVYKLPTELAEFLFDRARGASKAMEKMSPLQQQKIAKTIRDNPDRFVQSGLFRAMQRDVEMFGSEAFAKYDDCIGDDSE